MFVPINNNATMLDLMLQLGAPVVVAARTALGTINHTLLTVSAIRNANLNLRGVVMIGEENLDNRRAIADLVGSFHQAAEHVPITSRELHQHLLGAIGARHGQ